MWHLRTKQGVFWVIKHGQSGDRQYRLGIDDLELGVYAKAEDAVRDVCSQATGHLQWDSQTSIRVPEQINDWRRGQPEGW